MSRPLSSATAAQFRLQVRAVPLTQHVAGHVDQRHLLARPDRLDLPGELDADRARPEQQHPARRGERRVRAAHLAVRGLGAGQVGFGRERVAGPGGQDEVVREEFGARGEYHPVGVGLDRPVLDHPACAQQLGERLREAEDQVLAGLDEADDRQAFRTLLQRLSMHAATALDSATPDPCTVGPAPAPEDC